MNQANAPHQTRGVMCVVRFSYEIHEWSIGNVQRRTMFAHCATCATCAASPAERKSAYIRL